MTRGEMPTKHDDDSLPRGMIICADDDPRPRPEDVDDDERRAILERALDGAAASAKRDHDRRVAAGIIDEAGRLLKRPAASTHSDDGGGW